MHVPFYLFPKYYWKNNEKHPRLENRERSDEEEAKESRRYVLLNDRYPLREFTILNHRAQLEPGQARIPSL